MLGVAPKETSTSAKIFVPTASTERASSPVAMKTSTVCLPSSGRGEYVTERDVVEQVAVVVDGETVDGIGMQRVGLRVGVEDEYGPRRVRGRLEGIEIAEVESLVSQRRSEAEAGEMVGHGYISS